MSESKNGIKGVAKTLAGVALLAVVAAALVTYFTNIISANMFYSLVFVVAAGLLLATYFGWLAIRAGIVAVVVTVVFVIGVAFFKMPVISSNRFQSVTLTSGQVFFGHLDYADRNTMVLTNVYYLTAEQASQTEGEATPQSQPTLIKLGNEIHAPEDKLTLKSNQVLFWANLQDNGKVVEAIKRYEQQ